MNLKPTKPLSGFVELLPAEQRFFDQCVAKMQAVARLAGFQYIDLPAIERAEVLTDEADWEDVKTEMYLFQKGDTKMGLRYDGTVGLARYVAKNLSDLDFPCRLTQFSKRYRGERPQKGRYREFYQLDLDILGQDALPLSADAEVVATLARVYDSLPEVFGEYVINIGSRTFWNALAGALGLDAGATTRLFMLIDKKAKMDAKDWEQGVREIVGEKNVGVIMGVFEKGIEQFEIPAFAGMTAPINEIKEFMALLAEMGVKNARLNMATMRGLGYYDGLVYEPESITYPELGAIGGGGRYGNLVGKFSKTRIIGSGAGIGATRAIITALESGRIDPSKYAAQADIVVLPMGTAQMANALKIAEKMRGNGVVASVFLDSGKKFKNQMEYADKIRAKFAIIIGEDEVAKGVLAVKDMGTGEQVNLSLEEAIEKVKG